MLGSNSVSGPASVTASTPSVVKTRTTNASGDYPFTLRLQGLVTSVRRPKLPVSITSNKHNQASPFVAPGPSCNMQQLEMTTPSDTNVSNLFSGSSLFVNCEEIIVDVDLITTVLYIQQQ